MTNRASIGQHFTEYFSLQKVLPNSAEGCPFGTFVWVTTLGIYGSKGDTSQVIHLNASLLLGILRGEYSVFNVVEKSDPCQLEFLGLKVKGMTLVSQLLKISVANECMKKMMKFKDLCPN